jgi:uncharacterized membrane protein
MNNEWIYVLILTAALGCGLVGGIFFGFSVFIMKALKRLPPAQGISAMQSINVTVINPLFMAAFFGTALVCAILTIYSFFNWHIPGIVFLLVGSILYIFGTILVTIVFNVPRNDALATVDPMSAEGFQLWQGYVAGWAVWNHVRTIASLAAATVLSIALLF